MPPSISIETAGASDRNRIYALRHEVYAVELGQHAVRPERELSDALDERNRYLVARVDGTFAGFVSITPPGAEYSIDRYLSRGALPFLFDDRLWEIRILTVAQEFRGSPVAFLLMYAAFREIESEGGERIVAIGRKEVLGLYERVGMQVIGPEFRSGAVTFQPMIVTIEELRGSARLHEDTIASLRPRVAWNLPIPFRSPDGCEHGGVFFQGIGERFDRLERRHDIIPADVLDAWYPPAPGVIAALRENIDWIARTSPPAAAPGMLEKISSVRDLPARALVAGAGSSDLIYRVFPRWLTAGARVLILDPMYGEYAHILEQVIGCSVERFTLSRDEGYLPDIEQLAATVARGFDLVVLVNPNSPTGVYLDADRIESLIANAPEETRFWIDETYIELVPEGRSLERFAAASRNTFILKSMSKVYALSGLRVGYLVGPPRLLESIRMMTPPWIVNLAAQIAAVRALEDTRYYTACWRQTASLRSENAICLRQLGLSIFVGVTNSILIFPAPDQPSAADLISFCRERGLYLRDATTMGRSFLAGTIRIAVRDPYANTRMLTILGDALKQGRG